MIPYVYTSEWQAKPTSIATCPTHGRDICIHRNQAKAAKVAEAHDRLFHHG